MGNNTLSSGAGIYPAKFSYNSLDSLNKNSDSSQFSSNRVILNNDSLRPEASLKWYDMFTNIPTDMVVFYNQEFKANRIPLYTGIAAVTAGLIITDNKTWRASDKFYRKTQFNQNISDLFVEIGDGKSQFVLAAGFAAYGFISKDSRSVRTASEVVEAVLASGAVVQVLKHLTGRQSPCSSTQDGGLWRFFPNQIQYHKHVSAYDAFPSGHLTTSLAAFVVIAANYPEAKWITPAYIATETLLAVGMVNQGIHWYSDYPLAILLGYTFGVIAARNVNSISNYNFSDLHIGPYFGHIYKGVSLSYNF